MANTANNLYLRQLNFDTLIETKQSVHNFYDVAELTPTWPARLVNDFCRDLLSFLLRTVLLSGYQRFSSCGSFAARKKKNTDSLKVPPIIPPPPSVFETYPIKKKGFAGLVHLGSVKAGGFGTAGYCMCPYR